jgi:hypothetical protein
MAQSEWGMAFNKCSRGVPPKLTDSPDHILTTAQVAMSIKRMSRFRSVSMTLLQVAELI